MLIQKLIAESTSTASSVDGRPALVGLTRAVNELLMNDLVAIQPTTKPQAVVYGLRYETPFGAKTFITPATYSGKYGSREAIPLIAEDSTLLPGTVYKDANDVVYMCLKNATVATAPGENLQQKIEIMVMTLHLRLASEVAPVNYDTKSEVQEPRFKLDLWKVDTGVRDYKTELTHELIQDMNANHINADNVIEDTLATTISEEINKDIMQTLQTVSQRYVTKLTPGGICDMTSIADDPSTGRELYRMVCNMATSIVGDTSFGATWVLGSPRAVGYLASSGWLRKDPAKPMAEGVLVNGLTVYIDAVTTFDYLIVGTNIKSGDIDDNCSSLYYIPMQDIDEAGAFKFTMDPQALQPMVYAHARYALSVNPYTMREDHVENTGYIQGDDWDNLAGRSPYSKFLGIIFPEV